MHWAESRLLVEITRKQIRKIRIRNRSEVRPIAFEHREDGSLQREEALNMKLRKWIFESVFACQTQLSLLIRFRELWMLVSGLMNSARVVFFTVVLLGGITYLFACISIELIALPALESSVFFLKCEASKIY